MQPHEDIKALMQVNTDDFNTMRSMLSDIEIKIMQLHPLHQRRFYQPLLYAILEAHIDASNADDTYLYKNNEPLK